jgi:hypothetical protein
MVRWFSRREEVRVPDHGMHEIFSIYFAFGEGRLFAWVAWKVDVCFIFFEVKKKRSNLACFDRGVESREAIEG